MADKWDEKTTEIFARHLSHVPERYIEGWLHGSIAQALRDAVAAERERCAKIAEEAAERFHVPELIGDYRDGQYHTAKEIAAAIRAAA